MIKARYFESGVKLILKRWTQNLCPYHKGEVKDIGNGFSVRIIWDESGYKVIFEKENTIVDSFRINYCPFCGKELE